MLERAGGVVSRDTLSEAQPVGSRLAGLAVPAGAGNPFHADAVADLQVGGFSARAEFGDFAYTFVAAYLAGLGWEGKGFPLRALALYFIIYGKHG